MPVKFASLLHTPVCARSRLTEELRARYLSNLRVTLHVYCVPYSCLTDRRIARPVPVKFASHTTCILRTVLVSKCAPDTCQICESSDDGVSISQPRSYPSLCCCDCDTVRLVVAWSEPTRTPQAAASALAGLPQRYDEVAINKGGEVGFDERGMQLIASGLHLHEDTLGVSLRAHTR